MLKFLSLSALLAPFVLATACTTLKPTTQELMVAPDVSHIQETENYNLDEKNVDEEFLSVLFATARVRAPADSAVPFLNERDNLLHLGEADIEVINEGLNWEDLRQAEDSKVLSGNFTLGVSNINNFGPLDDALHSFVDPKRLPEDIEAASLAFAEEVNQRLENNRIPEIVIYVHGVNTAFETPLIYAAELTHFLRYQTVPIAFSWASGQLLSNYISDVDTAEYTATMFRHFLNFLLRETNAEKIHIIAYSAGTKLVSQALYQMALAGSASAVPEHRGRIGRIHLVAGDVERQLFGMYIADGLLDVAESFTIYMSETDKALRMSQTIRKYPRLGQTWEEGTLDRQTISVLEKLNIDFIDVTGLEGSKDGSGHNYFKASAWVSSDLLISAGLGLNAGDRGLQYIPDEGVWCFPEDYIFRLTMTAENQNIPRE